MGQHGRVFPQGPSLWNPAKHASIGNVPKYYLSVLWEGTGSGNAVPPRGGAALILEYESVEQMRGSMSQKAVTEPAAFERANYIRALNTFDQYVR